MRFLESDLMVKKKIAQRAPPGTREPLGKHACILHIGLYGVGRLACTRFRGFFPWIKHAYFSPPQKPDGKKIMEREKLPPKIISAIFLAIFVLHLILLP